MALRSGFCCTQCKRCALLFQSSGETSGSGGYLPGLLQSRQIKWKSPVLRQRIFEWLPGHSFLLQCEGQYLKFQGTGFGFFFKLQVVVVYGGGNYQFVLAKRDKTTVRFVKGISYQCQIYTAVQHSCHSAEAVGLPGMEVYIRYLAGKGTENVWQKIR